MGVSKTKHYPMIWYWIKPSSWVANSMQPNLRLAPSYIAEFEIDTSGSDNLVVNQAEPVRL